MKSLLSAVALFIAVLSAQAQEQETLYRSELPSKVRSFLTNFKSPFHHAVRQIDEDTTTYGITLNDRTEIKFSENGIWTMIDGKGKAVPLKFLGKSFQEYVKTNLKDIAVTRIERCDSGCKMALSNGQGLQFEFDAKGTVIAAVN
jgi:hypothetical protein